MFDFRVTSIFQLVQDLVPLHEHVLADLLCQYEQQNEMLPLPDRALLQQALSLLQSRLTDRFLDHEIMSLALNVYSNLGMYDETVALFRRYLQNVSITHEEQAWAFWVVIDCLALAHHDHESVEEQTKFISWARHTIPLEDCFFTLSDGTQAMSWYCTDQAQKWFDYVNDLLRVAPQTANNRLERFYALRSAAMMSLQCADVAQARWYLDLLRMLLVEDVHWSEAPWIAIEGNVIELKIADACGEIPTVQMITEQTSQMLLDWETSVDCDHLDEMKRFRSLCHNIAAPLYRAKKYAEAIPLFEKAIHYHTHVWQSYAWLAAAIWQTTHQYDHVLTLLQQASVRFDWSGQPWETIKLLPEFKHVQTDPAFIQATNV